MNGDVEVSRDTHADEADRLRTVELELVGRFADASNATLLVRLLDGDAPTLAELAAALGHEPSLDELDPHHLAVYKPRRGEAPLWDFPAGTLHRREVAAFAVSEALGWGLVPTTVLREDAPLGPGSLQRFVAHDPSLHYFRLLEVGSDAVLASLRRMVVFDLVIDNADRKGGHVLLAAGSGQDRPGSVDGTVQLVDHGVSFNVDRKLRTVAWEFAGEPVPAEVRADVARLADALAGDLGTRVAGLLSDAEVEVLRRRAERLVDLAEFPEPWGPRAYPWPPL